MKKLARGPVLLDRRGINNISQLKDRAIVSRQPRRRSRRIEFANPSSLITKEIHENFASLGASSLEARLKSVCFPFFFFFLITSLHEDKVSSSTFFYRRVTFRGKTRKRALRDRNIGCRINEIARIISERIRPRARFSVAALF